MIEKWLRNKNTLEFIGIWEEIYNPDFNSPEFEGIKNQAGLKLNVIAIHQLKLLTTDTSLKSIENRGKRR